METGLRQSEAEPIATMARGDTDADPLRPKHPPSRGQDGGSRIGERIRSIDAAAIAGVVFTVLALAALALLSNYPAVNVSDEELTAWFDEPDNQATLILGLQLATTAAIAFLWFVAVVRRRIGRREDKFFATVFLGSAVLYTAVWVAGTATLAAPAVALVMLDAGSMDPATVTLAGGVGAALLLVVAPKLQAVFVLATSNVIYRAKVLPRWLPAIGVVVAVGLFIFPFLARPTGIVFPIWVLVVSLTILVHRRRSDRSREPGGEGRGTDPGQT